MLSGGSVKYKIRKIIEVRSEGAADRAIDTQPDYEDEIGCKRQIVQESKVQEGTGIPYKRSDADKRPQLRKSNPTGFTHSGFLSIGREVRV